MNSIELLNSEGPVMILEKNNDFFVLKNTKKRIIACLSKKEILDFILGDVSIFDSGDEIVWNYKNYPDSMKKEISLVMDFIG